MRRQGILAMAAAAALLAACDIGLETDAIIGNGNVVTDDRPVQAFRGVSLETIGTVVIVQSDTVSLHLEGESNLLEEIITEVDGSTLRIRTPRGVTLRATEPLTITVNLVELEHLVLSSSGSIQADTVRTDGLAMVNSGSGSVSLGVVETGDLTTVVSGSGGLGVDSLSAATVQTTISGSGPFTAAGSAGSHVIVVSGSGPLQAPGLVTSIVEAVVSGSGSVVVRVVVRLNVVVSGSGSLSYYGSPVVSQTVTGSGTVQRLGD